MLKWSPIYYGRQSENNTRPDQAKTTPGQKTKKTEKQTQKATAPSLGRPWIRHQFLVFMFFIEASVHFLQWRTKFRKAMNKADNDASTRAIDSLINYEVRLWCTFNVWFSPYGSFDALFSPYGLFDALFSPILSIFS